MNLFEKLNRLDDSLFESKRVVKKKKLAEGYRVDPEISKFNVGDRVAERYNDSEFNVGTIVEIKKDEQGTQYLVRWDYSDREDTEWLYGDVLSLWIEDETRDVYDDDIDEMLTENRWNPYFTPYGYKDAAKVLNGKAPEYYYHLKHIEMDTGDGIRLARHALRKGLPVMVDKNSDPDYPEFAIKGEYHWDDYFYPYPTAHEEDLVAWDGKMFVEDQLTEATIKDWADSDLEGPGLWDTLDSAESADYKFFNDNLKTEGSYEDLRKMYIDCDSEYGCLFNCKLDDVNKIVYYSTSRVRI